ncbi:MAG TPA: glycosyltransferase family 9 protein, partial [Chlamydiales bacterium]|nr:glycosyltransferase family 9 protein [Chlamydiales bacterium]
MGNVTFRDIGEALDRSYVSEFIWIDPDAFDDDATYLLSIILKLKMRGFDVAINPIHARGTLYENMLFFSGSKKIIGGTGDLPGHSKFHDKDYDQLIPTPHHSQFEFFRNRAFFASLTGKEDHTAFALPFNKSPHIDSSRINVVICPGAGGVTRQWPPSSFASLIGIMEKNNPGAFQFIIAGGPGDDRLAAEIKASVNFPLLDLAGKTSLIELIDLIGNCQLLISNESSPVHMAAATGVPAICISNG